MSTIQSSTLKSSKGRGGGHSQTATPVYKKYDKVTKYSRDPNIKLKPSDLGQASVNIAGEDYPMIIEFVNILDNTSQIHSTVDIERPLFEPAPNLIIFEDYSPFAIHEKKLFFRNKDSVARRIKIMSSESPFFEVSAPRGPTGELLKQSKVAAGMEICFIIKFKAQEIRDYSYDLVCSTEREKFLVPIRAIGNRPRVTFPDELHFGKVPVKSTCSKMMFVQNIGLSTAKFTMRTHDSIFSCHGEETIMEPGTSTMVEVKFTPSAARSFEGDVEVEFFKGARCFIKMFGSGENVDVSLSTPSLSVDPCYISLSSQKTLRIINHSDSPITFAWKSFATTHEEAEERSRLLKDISRMESIEIEQFSQSVRRGEFSSDVGTDPDGNESDDSMDDGANMPFSARAVEAALIRKYRNLRVALEKDPMMFVDDIFDLSPASGQVWSNSELEITVSFRPDTQAQFSCLSYLDISGREDRLCLSLNGQGTGPQASLSYDVLDTGDVFINDDQNYQVTITNKGDIPAQWRFLPSLTKFGSRFQFKPSEGHLAPGESQLIEIKFASDILGEFSEHFRFSLQGNDDMLLFQVKGHVIGPTFHLDCKSIDFGVVSFDYLHTTTTRLVNSSKIPMMYNLHIPQDGSYLKREFDISPSDGVLVPGEFVDVVIEFIPNQAKVYDYSLAVDVYGVGDMLLSVPIHAQCIVESIQLAKRDVHYGDCFLRYPYTADFVLINTSEVVRTKYEILPQQPHTTAIATFEADPPVGFIEPGESAIVKVRLVVDKLGQSKVPITVAVAGSLEPPINAALNFNCIGPRVIVDKPEVKWGNVECLQNDVRTLRITNDSPIPASMNFFLKIARSRYDIAIREAMLDPNQFIDLDITANVDDTIVHKDELHIVVADSDNLMVPLSAKGTGTTMYCSQDIQIIDFGPQLTNNGFERKITLENKGRRPQQLRWYNDTIRIENANRASKIKTLKVVPTTLPKHLAPAEPIFTVFPMEVTLRSRTATSFVFKGISNIPGLLSEKFVLESKVGKDRNIIPIIQTIAQADIMNPLLEFSVKDMYFLYRWEPEVEPAAIKKDLTLTNKSLVTLSFILKTEIPFNLSIWEYTLAPDESLTVTIEFDPCFRDDKESCIVEKLLSIQYRGHSQRDSIKLTAENIFPNIKFETNTVNFGCILNETEKKIRLKMMNSSQVVVTYNWQFMENDIPNKSSKGDRKLSTFHRSMSTMQVSIPPNQAFDILPIRSVLQPGESEDTEFVMFGNSNTKFNCWAVCEVEGGPDYKIALVGEASTVSYSFDKSFLDFGKILYTEKKEENIVLHNNGRVPITFSIDFASLTSVGLIEAVPTSGKVQSGEKCQILLRFIPGVPKFYAETLYINVAHFDPIRFLCYAQGTFPVVTVTLPRNRRLGPYGEKENTSTLWSEFVNIATRNICFPNPALLPPDETSAPLPASASSAIPMVYETPRLIVPDTTRDEQELPTSPNQALLEVEMSRLAFSYHLESAISVHRKTLPPPDEMLCDQSVVARCIDVQELNAATYICDFGNVITGAIKKKVFKITNSANAGPMSWSFDTVALGQNGLSIEPEGATKLPEGGFVEFTLKLVTRTLKPGKKKFTLPINTKGTPIYQVVIQANICVPEIEVSNEYVNFDRVYLGCSKKMFFCLHNTTPVIANWTLRKPVGHRDEAKFICRPSSGVLRSGKKTIVSVEFMPTEARKHSMDLSLKIDNNPKHKAISVLGEALGTLLKFEPSFVELGPILPFSNGQEKIVTVTSNSEIPLEFYSLDFDEQYQEEERILSAVSDIFDEDGFCRVKLRSAGESLQDKFLSAHQAAQALLEAPSFVDSDANGREELNESKRIPPPIRSFLAPRDENLQQDILVISPPISGCTSVCAYLGKKLNLPVMTIDEIFTDVMNTDSDISLRLRRALNRLNESELALIKEKEDALQASADKSKAEAAEKFKKENKKATSVPDEVLATPEVQALVEFQKDDVLSVELFASIIQHRISWTDLGYGVIFDGITSLFADEVLLLRGLKASIDKLVVCSLAYPESEDIFSERMASLYAQKLADQAKFSKALQAEKKRLMLQAKKKKKGKSASLTAKLDILSTQGSEITEDYVFPVAIPQGDEPWLDINGRVVELDPQDVRSLEDHQKLDYNAQLRYSQQNELAQASDVLFAITRIWSPDTGLFSEYSESPSVVISEKADVYEQPIIDSSVAQPVEGGAVDDQIQQESIPVVEPKKKVVFFKTFRDIVLPLVKELFTVSASSNTAEGHVEAVIDSSVDPESAVLAETVKEVIDHGLFEIPIGEDDKEDSVCQNALALIPAAKVPPLDKDAIPVPIETQLVKKFYPRLDRKRIHNFEILRHIEEPVVVEGEQIPMPVTFPEPSSPYRWIVPPFGKVHLKVKFMSSSEGKFDSVLMFEVMGSKQEYSIFCSGRSEVPKINSDSRMVFMKRIKSFTPNAPLPIRRFVVNENCFSFGPLLSFKQSEWRTDLPADAPVEAIKLHDVVKGTNCETIRLTNIGSYACTVDLGMQMLDPTPIFFVDNNKIILEEGETKDLKIWAFPKTAELFKNTLIACVSNNPDPVCFDLICSGVIPTVELNGPWEEAATAALASAEAAVVECKDPKQLKDLEAKRDAVKSNISNPNTPLLIPFERMLIGKTDIMTFTMKNTCNLPVTYIIDPMEFQDSPNITVSPSSGILAPGVMVTLSVSFFSKEPILVNGKFAIKYSDVEGGLDDPQRISTRVFNVQAEAYNIQAVSLTSEGQEQGGHDVDFGVLRVGDFAHKTVKITNRGKYKIAYRISFKRQATAALLALDPPEGFIEPGAISDIKVVFCAKKSAASLISNKDVRIIISEPKTNELVEEFPLHISAQAVYSKYRMQPAKGVTFGAVRFDSEAKSKRVELRNEGKYQLTYVICPSSSEINEIDTLDPAAFSLYAFGLPAALRSSELGDDFKSRVAGGGGAPVAPAGGKAAAKPPAKGAPAPAIADTSTAQWNPFVKDPDELAPCVVPSDPLVVGAFTVIQRAGVIQPGETSGFDIKFDPSGCESAHERLRILLAGVDPLDSSSMVLLKNFDVTGDSCIPAIVDDDMNGIFEEQEVVSQLSEASSSGGIEKLPVGKVVFASQENMLAFGPVLCNNTGAKGVLERIKITNPTKIDAKVKFSIAAGTKSADVAAAAAVAAPAKGAKGAPVPATPVQEVLNFTVHPESWEIPPHEHRFVNIYFNPTEIKTYKAVFMAEVDTAGLQAVMTSKRGNKGQKLSFDLAGSGTLPCISVEEPTSRNAEGLLLDFKRVHVYKTSKRSITLRNDGVMPSTCLFEITGNIDDFNFPFKGSSITITPGGRETVHVYFNPKSLDGSADRKATVKISVLNNQFDTYGINVCGTTYACDAVLDSSESPAGESQEENLGDEEKVIFPELNLASGPGTVSKKIFLRGRSDQYIKYEFAATDSCAGLISFTPSIGHLGPSTVKEITLSFSAKEPVKLDAAMISCSLKKINYSSESSDPPDDVSRDLLGRWDNAMKIVRPASEEDLNIISAAKSAMEAYLSNKAAEEAKGKKGKPVGPPPEPISLELAPDSEDGTKMIYEIMMEPKYIVVEGAPQVLNMSCSAVADVAKFSLDTQDYIAFIPTYMFQTAVHQFTFTNESNISLPVNWTFEEQIRRRGTTRAGTSQTMRAQSRLGTAPATASTGSSYCPFSIEPPFSEVAPKSAQTFTLKFLPLDSGDFEYMLKGETAELPTSPEGEMPEPIRIGVYGTGNRPICHFEVIETPDYLNRRAGNLKNENGLLSPIETANLRVVELESTGLKTRNTFRFHVINPTAENYDFIWEAVGDPSPFWRCVQSSGMLFAGKRVEMVFEYLPEDSQVAEAFIKFKLPKVGLEQLFLFAGKVTEPRVAFSTSKIDFHSVVLGGEGATETIYIENQEHLPFNFVIDKLSLSQLESSEGLVLDIQPKSGMVAPHGRFPITLNFVPREEIVYNFNIQCEVKRKPNKLSFNIKGEGYGIHPVVTIEQIDHNGVRNVNLKPLPSINYADFGAVQVLDSVMKKISVLNNGKYNFDYIWDAENLNPMISIAGGRMGGTLHKGESMDYTVTFAPSRECNLEGSMLSFTVAGKYTYNIQTRGSGVHPALRFSFMHHDFGPCFITSPGGLTVVEDALLRLTNNDPVNNISIECGFQKTRALWVECPPTVLEPGAILDIPIRFSPRDVKDYAFVIPFVINGTGKANVNILGSGINARLELASQGQRRLNFGTVSVGGSISKAVTLVNRSKKALGVEFVDEARYGVGALEERCVSYQPRNEFTIPPKGTSTFQVSFNPTRRVGQFVEDLYVKYAGLSRKLLTIAGKAQGLELSLDADSLPFGTVVESSQRVKKLSLENSGDLEVTFNWMESSFGPHFSIAPLFGKVSPGMEVTFEVTFRPQRVDPDIQQDNILLMIPGYPPLSITCSGVCISQPDDSIQTLSFSSLARKSEVKPVKLTNPTDKDWFLSPSMSGDHWKIPFEVKVPAKGNADLLVTYFPLTMTSTESDAQPHIGKLFIALPDGTAQLYNLTGKAGSPECSGQLQLETSAKKPAIVTAKIVNWLGETQKLITSIEMLEKPSPACFLVAANAVEVGPYASKEFHMRFLSFVEGSAKAKVTFTNVSTGEYCFYEVSAKITGAEVLEEIVMESPVRQTARYIISAENPLPKDAIVTMGSVGKPDEWWTCDSKNIKLNELHPFQGYPEGSFEIEYRPLVPTKSHQEHLLSIYSKELGSFKYKLKVTCLPQSNMQRLTFDVPLGSTQTELYRFKAYNTSAMTFNCAVTKPDFFAVAKTLPVEAAKTWDGVDAAVSIVFEPTSIGELRDVLTVTSPEGGEYSCELVAKCQAPLPQGPFAFKQGVSVDIPFRNCFTTQTNWSFNVDSPMYRIASSTASVAAKSQGNVSVVFEAQGAPIGVVSAKLFVRCESKPELPPWVFYLRGTVEAPDPNAPAASAAGGGKKK